MSAFIKISAPNLERTGECLSVRATFVLFNSRMFDFTSNSIGGQVIPPKDSQLWLSS